MTPSPRPEPPRAPWIPGAGAAALGALTAYSIGAGAQRRGQLDVYVVMLSALLLAGAVVMLRRRDRPAEACGLALGLVPTALPLWLATAGAERMSLTYERSLELAELRFGFLFVVPALIYATVAAGRGAGRILVSTTSLRAARAIRVVAWAATLGAVALLIAWGASARLPTAPQYVGSLPVVATFDEVDRSRYAPAIEDGGDGIVRRALRKGCWIGEERDAAAADALVPSHEYWSLRTCGPLRIRADERRGLLVVVDEGGRWVTLDRAHGWLPASLPPVRLTRSVRPPDGFAAMAVLGLAGALVALLWPRRSRLPADEGACRDADLLADGTVRFVDEAVSPGSAVALGPVVAVLGTAAESFRDHAGPAVVKTVPGTIAEHRFAARVGAAAIALAFVVIACTPLLAAFACLR